MKRYIETRFGQIAFALAVLLFLALGCYIGVGSLTSEVIDIDERVNRPPRTAAQRGINCTESCPDGRNGTAGVDGPNGTCPVSCQNGTDGTDGTDGLNVNLTIILSGDNDTTVSVLSLLSANMTILLTENDTFVPIPGPQGTPGTDGANGTDGTQGPAGPGGRNGTNGTSGAQGPHGVNGTCPACVNGSNGANGADGADGIAHITVRTNNGTSIVSYNTSFANITITVSPNSTFVSLGGQQGAPGTNGQNGTNGLNGVNATQCTPCVNGTNGVNGHNGTDGINGTGIGTDFPDKRAIGSINSNAQSGTSVGMITNTPTPVPGSYGAGALYRTFTQAQELVWNFTLASPAILMANIGFTYSNTTSVTIQLGLLAADGVATFCCYGGPVSVVPGLFATVGCSCTANLLPVGNSLIIPTAALIYVSAAAPGTYANYKSTLSMLTLG